MDRMRRQVTHRYSLVRPALALSLITSMLGLTVPAIVLSGGVSAATGSMTCASGTIVLEAQLSRIDGVRASTQPASKDRKSTRLNSSHIPLSRMPSSA